jgi:hypothetical protein
VTRAKVLLRAAAGLWCARSARRASSDVFISANSKINSALLGAKNGDWVKWHIGFAQAPLLIGHSASSKSAEQAIRPGAIRWIVVFSQWEI